MTKARPFKHLLRCDRLSPARKRGCQRILKGYKRDAQVSREVDIKALVDGEVVAKQLQGDNVEQALKAVNSLRHADSLNILRDTLIALIAYDDGLGLARGNLGERRLDLGVERVTCHNNDHRHVLVDKCKRTVFQLPSKDT